MNDDFDYIQDLLESWSDFSLEVLLSNNPRETYENRMSLDTDPDDHEYDDCM